jgi:hypothetical protein
MAAAITLSVAAARPIPLPIAALVGQGKILRRDNGSGEQGRRRNYHEGGGYAG